jgi:hypothetical protein
MCRGHRYCSLTDEPELVQSGYAGKIQSSQTPGQAEILSTADVLGSTKHPADHRARGDQVPFSDGARIWAEAGADVDFDRMIVKGAAGLDQICLASCHSSYLLARSAAGSAARQQSVYLGTDGCE